MTIDNYQCLITIINDDLFNFLIVPVGEIFYLHKLVIQILKSFFIPI